MLKTPVAQVYCSRRLTAEACPYANICEQCDNFVTTTEFIPALQAQLAESPHCKTTPPYAGWDTDVACHARLITSIQTTSIDSTDKSRSTTHDPSPEGQSVEIYLLLHRPAKNSLLQRLHRPRPQRPASPKSRPCPLDHRGERGIDVLR